MENSCGVPGAPNPCAVMLMRDSNMASLPSKPDEVMRSAKRAAAARQSNIALLRVFRARARGAWRGVCLDNT
jgi:pyruvate carboxylase